MAISDGQNVQDLFLTQARQGQLLNHSEYCIGTKGTVLVNTSGLTTQSSLLRPELWLEL
jgi:hypothetical protein